MHFPFFMFACIVTDWVVHLGSASFLGAADKALITLFTQNIAFAWAWRVMMRGGVMPQ